MSELSRDAKALIEQGRSGSEPSAHDKARVRARLVTELGVGAFASAAIVGAAAGSASIGATSAKLAKGASGWWLKAALAVSVATGGSLALYAAQPHDDAARRPPAAREASPSPEPLSSARPSVIQLDSKASPGVGLEPNGAAAVSAAEPAPAARKRARHARSVSSEPAAAATPSSTVAPPAAPSLGDELALLARAQRALREGRAAEALTLARRHALDFPAGALGEEREGIEALALCMLGERAEASARAFLARAPSSPLAARVRKECGVK